MSPSARQSISVIVPTHGAEDSLRKCLSSLSQAVPSPSELIVVADGEAGDAGHIAQEFGAKLLTTPERGGPARARNLGAHKAQGDILFFLDADVAVSPNAVGRAVAVFAQEPGVDAVIGSYDDEPAAPNFLSQYKNLFHHYVHQTANEQACTFWGACGAIRRDVFLALDGFDEAYRCPSVEDIELGYRLTRAGGRIRLCKALQVKHLKRWSVLPLLRSDILLRALPWTDLILRDRRLIDDLNLRLSSRISVALTLGLAGTVVGAAWQPWLLALSGASVLSLLALNAPLYWFFLRKRGLRFAVSAVPWHWFYYLYSGLAFVVGAARFLLRRARCASSKAYRAVSNVD